jgi:hypothetical protein
MMIHFAIFARLFRTCFADANATVALPCIGPLVRPRDVSPETRMFSLDKTLLACGASATQDIYGDIPSKRLYEPT